MRASYRAVAPPPDLLPAPRFSQRLEEAIKQARGQQQALAVVVLQMAGPPPEPRRQQVLEMPLRLDVREGDVPGRLSETTFAVLLPETDETAIVVAARLQRALANITGQPVTTGVAYYPADAATARKLLQIASSRC